MKFWQKDKIILGLLVLTSILIISCSQKETKKEEVEISFSWWGKENRHNYTMEGITRFEEKNPNIKINPRACSWLEYEEKIGKEILSGECADVVQLNFDWLYKYSPDGNSFYDFNQLKDYIDLYNFTLDDLSYGTFGGKLNAIPLAFNTAIPVYDMKILRANSLGIPSTWDQLFETARVLRKKGLHVFTLSKRHLFFLAISWFEQTYSKKVFNPDQTLNISIEEVEIIYDFVKKLIDEKVVYSIDEGMQIEAIRDRKVCGAVYWCNETSIFLSEVIALDGEPVLGNFITKPGAIESGWYLKPASLYAIKKDCKNPKEAAIFVDYLLNSPDFALLQKNDKGVPLSNKSLTALMKANELESMQYKALMKIRFNSEVINQMLPIMEDEDIIDTFIDNAYAYSIGQEDKASASSDFLKDFKKLCEQM